MVQSQSSVEDVRLAGYLRISIFAFLGRICAILRSSTQRKEKTMREFWITVVSMVLGYLMYFGVKSMGRK